MTMLSELIGSGIDYVVDTSALIDLRMRYPPDIAPGAWELVEKMVGDRRLVSVDEVLEELSYKDDEIHAWAKRHAMMFFPLSVDIQRAGKAVLRSHPGLIDVKDRKGGADPFVVGAAKIYGAAVVTHEQLTRNPGKPHIPDVCGDLGVGCVDLVKLFRDEGLQLVQRV